MNGPLDLTAIRERRVTARDALDKMTLGWSETTPTRVQVLAALADERDLTDRVATVLAIHTKDPEVLIDHIHRGLTPVYGDGCGECGVAWPCDTAKALGVAP